MGKAYKKSDLPLALPQTDSHGRMWRVISELAGQRSYLNFGSQVTAQRHADHVLRSGGVVESVAVLVEEN